MEAFSEKHPSGKQRTDGRAGMEGKQEKQYGGGVLGNELYHLLDPRKSVG